MKIAIDARMYQESGIGRYIRNLLNHLQKIDKTNDYFILHLNKENDTLVYHNNFKKILADFRWYGIKEQLKLPKILNKIRPDLTHFPHINVPFFFKGKFIVTVHDLIHQYFQMRRVTTLDPITYKVKQFGYNIIFKNAIRKALKILVPSNYVKELLIENWKVDRKKIVVTYEAVDDKILTIVNILKKKQIEKIMQKLQVKPPYLFYVGNAHPHKNVEGLIKAFLILKKQYRYLRLVLSGNDHYFWQRIKKEYQYKDIIYTGKVNDEELVALYKNAQLFVMPSFEEGFGIPILEAMACEVPVVSSNKGALKEVGENACLYFDPTNIDEMVKKISFVSNDQSLRKQLIENGKKRVKDFSWEKLARKTLEVYSE